MSDNFEIHCIFCEMHRTQHLKMKKKVFNCLQVQWWAGCILTTIPLHLVQWKTCLMRRKWDFSTKFKRYELERKNKKKRKEEGKKKRAHVMNTPLGTAALCSIHQSQQFCCCYCTYQFRMHQHTCLIQFNLYFFQLLSSGTRTVIRKRVQENLMIKVAKTVTKPVFHPVDVITSVATPILHPVQTVSAVTEYLNFFPKKS